MISITELYRADYSPTSDYGDGKWVPSRPYGGFVPARFGRLRDAWAVFRGRAEAVQWPDQRAQEGSPR